MTDFDTYARSYEAIHAENVAGSGEPPSYFAAYKQQVLERMLGRDLDRAVLDFGCGIGTLTALLSRSFREVDGYDTSAESLSAARTRAPGARFFERVEAIPKEHYGAVVLANVLHHVPPADRPALLRTAAEMVARGGRVIVFEHNALNPITRRVVSACRFDDGASLLYPWEVRRLLRGAGLSAVALDFIVFFPRILRAARRLEPFLSWLPLGAQVCAWGTKK